MRHAEVDLYPSRTHPEPRKYARRDPVVYGSPHTGPLDAPTLERYERDGYLTFARVLGDEEVEGLAAAVDELRTREDVLARPEAIREPTSDGLRSIFRVHELHPRISELARDPRLVGLAAQILGSDVYVHQSRVNFKPAFVGKEFYWHSDFETWHVEDGLPNMRALSITIHLTESNEFNGPLLLVPGSHRTFVACVGETPSDHYKESLRRQRYGVPDPAIVTGLVADTGLVAAHGKPGSIVVFDCNTLHASGSNVSPYPRCSLFIVYNSVENLARRPFGGLPPRPEFIATRTITPLSPHASNA